ncbi:uncharacterized protein LOC141651249 [Silene latifolia]|uniref:uncharacterized protein LOC141651249 n=1 Tax=Silene latifolia TaxID=37657 RepID=UPI003D76CE8A
MSSRNPRKWENLPKELWEEILVKVPPSTILDMMLVYKRVYSVVMQPKFVLQHYRGNRTSPRELIVKHSNNGLLFPSSTPYPFNDLDSVKKYPQFPILFKNYRAEVVGQNNGLILLHHYKNKDEKWSGSNRITIWNCLTGKVAPIPNSELSKGIIGTKRVDVRVCYEYANNDYNIVVVAQDTKSKFVIEKFNYKDSRWSFQSLFNLPRLRLGPMTCTNQRICWVAGELHGDDDDRSEEFEYFVTCDMVGHKFTVKKLPQQTLSCSIVPVIFENTICVLTINDILLNENPSIDVWDFDEKLQKWIRLIKHNYFHPQLFVSVFGNLKTATYVAQDNKVVFYLENGKILSFLIDENRVKTYGDQVIFVDTTYVESLLFPRRP